MDAIKCKMVILSVHGVKSASTPILRFVFYIGIYVHILKMPSTTTCLKLFIAFKKHDPPSIIRRLIGFCNFPNT